MPQQYVKKILEARVYDVAIETPIDEARFLSERYHNRILIKREDLQPVFSFKLRGAYNKMSRLTTAQRAKGVIAASAGNHAQGLALSGKKLGINTVIVMPKTTPNIKVASVRARGAKVILHGDTYDEASAHSHKLAKEKGYTYVHPFDDPDVIAGQGTIGMEILRQVTGPLHAVFVPVGGGGLIAGVAAYIKFVRPDVKVIGVEAEDSACMKAALKKGRRVILPEVGIFADGVAVAQAGKETFRIVKQCVDEIVTVNTDEICGAIKDVFDDTRSIAEPAGALAVAGLKKYIETNSIRGKTLLAIDSGANVNFDRLRHISERSELGEKREAIIAVTIPEVPGSFKKFCGDLGKRNITEFNYRYADESDAQVFVGVQLSDGGKERAKLIAELGKLKYAVLDLTENEMAKLHVRHLVGGRAPKAQNELVFRFEFPERPGALMKFLQTLGQRWNISLFHYRNHGAAYGRVMVGLQVPANEKKRAEEYFRKIGYPFSEETANPAYQIFLS
ncbi:MAG: threonine ammonia-lyase, biosynthetic [Pseudomonadales bacterium]|nr:threonine ammonia-lyase, biosynthetic [Pseudomonadales bacterium]MCP5215986.1 threonine ammonia-lyase, biosynthetic [Pseudomonadales bacterium]